MGEGRSKSVDLALQTSVLAVKTFHNMTVHIYSCDTDVLVLALRRVPDLKPNSDHHGYWRSTMTNQTQAHLCCSRSERAATLPALTGSNTTGHTKGN